MKKLLLLTILAVTLSFNAISQNLLTVDYTATNPTSFTNCDGSFVINSLPNGTAPYAFNWYDVNGNLYYSSNTANFYNLCEGWYYVEIFDANCNYGYVSVDLESSTGNPASLSFENVVLNYETAPLVCDGSVEFGVNNYTSGMNVTISDIMTSNVIFTGEMLTNPMTSPSSVCLNDSLGIYIAISDSSDIYYAEFGVFNMNNWYWMGGFPSSCGGMYIWTETSLASDTNVCDGSASTMIWGGIPPFTYNYSTGGTNSIENNLCTGYYSVTVTDANGDTASTNFVIADSTNYYQMYFWGNPYDTLYSNALLNCDLDYTQPIDSMYLDSMYYTSAFDITVSYVIVQDTSEFLWTESYHIDSVANYVLSMSVYCDNRAMDDVYTMMVWLPMADMMAMGSPSQPIRPTDINAKIYPNPVEDILTTSFKLEKQSNVELSITDITGKLVSTKSLKANTGNNSVQMNVNGLSNGIYLVNYSVNGQKIQSLKMIKE